MARVLPRPRKPLSESVQERYWSRLSNPPPRDLRCFYQVCNGGRAPKLKVEFLGLKEAVDLALNYADFFKHFETFPICLMDDELSDPACVALSGPLRGYVYWHPHDTTMEY